MSENPFRVLIVARGESDCTLLEEAIAHAGFCPEPAFASLDDFVIQAARSRFDSVVFDCTSGEVAMENILHAIPPARLICLVNAVCKETALMALRQGADVLVKDTAGQYLKLLPLKMKMRVDALRPAIAEDVSGTVPLQNEYEQLTQSLFEHSPNMIFINAGGRVVYANEKCAQLTGYRKEDFYAPDFNFMVLVAPECFDIVKLNLGRHLRGQDVDPYDYTLVAKSGRRIDVIMSSKLIEYGGKNAILGIVTDISHRKRVEEELTSIRDELERRIEDRTTELVKTNESLLTEIKDRQRAEQALRESEERYRLISSLISDYVYSMSCEDGCCVEWISGAFEKITGYKPGEIKTLDDWFNLMHPDDVPAAGDATQRIFAGESVKSEYRIRTKDGRIRWLHDHVRPVRSEQTGSVVALVGAVRDVTERKQALEALKESELKFKTIFENAGGAIFVADVETGCIVECNAEAENLTGLPRHEIIGMHQTRLHPPEQADIYKHKFQQNVTEGKILDLECEVQHVDGRRIPVWISAQVMSLTDRKVAMGVFLDISPRRRADQQRAQLTEMLEEKNRELESIIHVAGHDLRTPLITISGFAGELQRSSRQLQDLLAAGSDLDEQAHAIVTQDIPEAVGLIAASAAKLNSLLDGLTRLARFEPPDTEMAAIDMDAMLADIIKTLTYLARNRAVEFRVAPLPRGWGDEQQINQVFSNLLGNALKYLDPSRPGFIAVKGEQTDSHTVYCVEDNGIGIDANNLPHIFKMYYRADPKQTDGQGLGLPIVRRILSRHNGRVWAESDCGRGSRFFVALPHAPT